MHVSLIFHLFTFRRTRALIKRNFLTVLRRNINITYVELVFLLLCEIVVEDARKQTHIVYTFVCVYFIFKQQSLWIIQQISFFVIFHSISMWTYAYVCVIVISSLLRFNKMLFFFCYFNRTVGNTVMVCCLSTVPIQYGEGIFTILFNKQTKNVKEVFSWIR